ncbi:hypothetical protein DLAC_08688 [Tieghemostelium lacteum]|uniref:LMBR1-like membrane protein n=1 Tax=Tieghemostelium lacteum TaxID=361077 RepID=A0A151Z805_TIELA|nr:hypothetical protein DLAC_08688 [Tieghemostelium lacteum]|eukprot:KYQ90103.1 hypothetical protein DLAC_08688 [Tieghemostelium lacteum]
MLLVFFIILFIVGLVTTHFIHRYISIKKVPLYVYFSAWIGWFMCFGIIALVPIDIIATSYNECTENNSQETSLCIQPLSYLSETQLYYSYQTFYFGTLLLTWLVYPILSSYVLAGDFHISERISTAIKENIYLYLIFAVIGFIILIWLLAVKNLDRTAIIGFAMAAANTWGLLLVIVLLGYGLVETPRTIWVLANRELVLKHLQFKAVDLLNAKKKAAEDLYNTLKSIKKIQEKTKPYDPYEKYVKIIVDQCPEEYKNVHHGEGTGEITYSALVSLNAKLKKDAQLAKRSEFLYEQCIMDAFALQDIMVSSRIAEDQIVHWSFREPRVGRWKIIDRLEWVWYSYLQGPIYRFLTLVFALLSLLVIWSEISVAVTSRDVSILSNIVKHSNMANVLIQVVVFFPLGYEALSTYSTLFKIRIFNYYRLIPHQHSDSNSIIFSAAYLCRLAAPLCFNFITFIQTQTTFSKVMGTMDVAPFLGNYFYIYFPLIIIVVFLATLFNLFSRILNFFNVSRFRFDTDFTHEQIDEGKFLLDSERRKWVNGKSILSNSVNNLGASSSSTGSVTSTSSATKNTITNKYSLLKNNNNSSSNNRFSINDSRDDFDQDIESAITYNSNFNTTPAANSPIQSNTRNSNLNGGFPSIDKMFGKNRYSQMKNDK